MIHKLVTNLDVGDRVDLEGDPFADPSADPDPEPHPFWSYEYGVVAGIERESEDCVRVDFDNGPSCGFPVDHTLAIGSDEREPADIASSLVTVMEALRERGAQLPSKEVQRAALAISRKPDALSVGIAPVILYHVKGGAPMPYMVTLNVIDGMILEAECSCPSPRMCKHLLAVLASATRDGYKLKT